MHQNNTGSANARPHATKGGLPQVLQHLDGEGLSRAAGVLRNLPQETVLVVGQAHSFITQIFEASDVVVKRNGCSYIEVT